MVCDAAVGACEAVVGICGIVVGVCVAVVGRGQAAGVGSSRRPITKVRSSYSAQAPVRNPKIKLSNGYFAWNASNTLPKDFGAPQSTTRG